MTPLAWAATALSAAVLAALTALPETRASARSAAPTASPEDGLLSRIERDVTEPLRRRDADRWRFSRVHRPTPAYRTVPDPERAVM